MPKLTLSLPYFVEKRAPILIWGVTLVKCHERACLCPARVLLVELPSKMCYRREAFKESLGHVLGPRQLCRELGRQFDLPVFPHWCPLARSAVPKACVFAACAAAQGGALSSLACIRVERRDEPVDRITQGDQNMAGLGGLMAGQRMGVNRGMQQLEAGLVHRSQIFVHPLRDSGTARVTNVHECEIFSRTPLV